MDTNNDKPGIECPECGTDVMVTGFTVMGGWSETYMRFVGGPVLIESTNKEAAVEAQCYQCGASLEMKPCDLMKAA